MHVIHVVPLSWKTLLQNLESPLAIVMEARFTGSNIVRYTTSGREGIAPNMHRLRPTESLAPTLMSVAHAGCNSDCDLH